MVNGLRLRGGQASNGPHGLDERFSVLSRQQKRRAASASELAQIRKKFCGRGRSGATVWPKEMPRKIARAIARARAAKHWREGEVYRGR